MAFPESVSKNDLARLLGVTSRWIGSLVADKVLKPNQQGHFPTVQSIAAFVQHREQVVADRLGGDESYTAARARKIRADAEMSELALAERKGKLVEIEPFVAGLQEDQSRMILNAKTRFLGVPSKLAARHGTFKTPGDLFTYATKECRAALTLLSGDYQAQADAKWKEIKDAREKRAREDREGEPSETP
jgi:phage terminase Nu1 subunit (DNA packaging protein)